MSEIGEKLFLKKLLTTLSPSQNFVNGFGDDSSLLDVGLTKFLSLKIDRAASPIASVRGWCDYKLWGRIAVTSNCSDILATGGIPYGMMLAISVPRDFESKKVIEIIQGADEECRSNNVAYLGGDTKESREANIVGCAVGLNDKDYCLSRKKVKKDDLIILAGQLGGYMGAYLSTIEYEKTHGNVRNCEEYIHYMSNPKAKWEEATFIRERKIATAGMDLSDGLLDALLTMTGDTLGAEIEIDKLPFHNFAINCADNFSLDITNFAFTVGDWGIVFSIPAERKEEIISAIKDGINLSIIGRWTDTKRIIAVNKLGDRFLVDGLINEHFVKRMEDQGDYMNSVKNNVLFKIINE
jgi:thiamine-monophosphate kinase